MIRSICVFCGSSPGNDPRYLAIARELGRALVRRGLRLVYGGASVGLMGAVADAVLEGGGEVIGVIPKSLAVKEVAHAGLDDLRVVGSMHERKALMEKLSDGFIALPGGFGTFEELCEIVTWGQLGLHRKPSGVLNVAGYYQGFLEFVDHAMASGFIRPEQRRLLLSETDPDRLLDQFAAYQPPPLPAWLKDESQT